MADEKMVTDTLEADVRLVNEGLDVIMAKLKRWQGQIIDPKIATQLNDVIHSLEKQKMQNDLIRLLAVILQAGLRTQGDKNA